MEVDDRFDSVPRRKVELPGEPVQPGVDPAVVIGEVEFGSEPAPVAHELEADQIHVPLLQRYEILFGHAVR